MPQEQGTREPGSRGGGWGWGWSSVCVCVHKHAKACMHAESRQQLKHGMEASKTFSVYICGHSVTLASWCASVLPAIQLSGGYCRHTDVLRAGTHKRRSETRQT